MNLFRQIVSAFRHSGAANMTDETRKSDTLAKVTASLLMSAASAVLTVLNIVNAYWFMMGTTLLLTVGFAFWALLFGRLRRRGAAIVMMAVLVGLIFSIYAIRGENEGFAILWILLVPPVGMSLIGLRAGTALSAYFQLFLIVLFYTPLRGAVSPSYTATFCVRFPVLYLTCFAAAVLLTAQKDYYYQKTEDMAFMDALTGVFNRRYYEDLKQKIVSGGRISELSLVSVDVNRLKYTNDTYGHQAGDQLLTSATACMRSAFPDAHAICRTGGDEFIIVLFSRPAQVKKGLEELEKAAAKVHLDFLPEMSFSIGYVCHAEHPEMAMEELERAADAAMYSDKEDFYAEHHTGRGQP